mmetsp:Transcript_109123/g.319393  ORF Transcript_109123/g.319393 Transcript_109123/m.319393 type:complete len:235 (-) Transcript_109123:255-959(-)
MARILGIPQNHMQLAELRDVEGCRRGQGKEEVGGIPWNLVEPDQEGVSPREGCVVNGLTRVTDCTSSGIADANLASPYSPVVHDAVCHKTNTMGTAVVYNLPQGLFLEHDAHTVKVISKLEPAFKGNLGGPVRAVLVSVLLLHVSRLVTGLALLGSAVSPVRPGVPGLATTVDSGSRQVDCSRALPAEVDSHMMQRLEDRRLQVQVLLSKALQRGGAQGLDESISEAILPDLPH